LEQVKESIFRNKQVKNQVKRTKTPPNQKNITCPLGEVKGMIQELLPFMESCYLGEALFSNNGLELVLKKIPRKNPY
jgi:hypothetical protein